MYLNSQYASLAFEARSNCDAPLSVFPSFGCRCSCEPRKILVNFLSDLACPHNGIAIQLPAKRVCCNGRLEFFSCMPSLCPRMTRFGKGLARKAKAKAPSHDGRCNCHLPNCVQGAPRCSQSLFLPEQKTDKCNSNGVAAQLPGVARSVAAAGYVS